MRTGTQASRVDAVETAEAPGILKCHRVAGSDEGIGDQVEGLFTSVGDEQRIAFHGETFSEKKGFVTGW